MNDPFKDDPWPPERPHPKTSYSPPNDPFDDGSPASLGAKAAFDPFEDAPPAQPSEATAPESPTPPQNGAQEQGTAPAHRMTKNGKEIPSPSVPTRDPKNQAEHMNKIMRSQKLRGKPSAQHVAFALSQFMWSEHGKEFGRKIEATRQFIAELTGLSINGADSAIRYAVEAGFFRRIDDGLGGKGSRNRATYVPTVPDYS